LNPEYYSGESFTIEAFNNSKDSKYVQSYTLNGETLHHPTLSFKDLVKGGYLKMDMGTTPVDNY
jgi:putative alpha-1,2-mannosidase